MSHQYSFTPTIEYLVISPTEVVNGNRQENMVRLTPVQTLKIETIPFIQNFSGGDDKDNPIVPPN
ncbi:hypothetical protein A0J48_011055 [Sphaerospermopsis aphanizomenoides BCCUSP55]|uniref:hypothetical protein n=1 Tax=Sphaerospermopsis aphanizomenoides TaxID=459663 RepID=UPI001905D4F7|nr:hypothetical protein [Sphaerospermopsis aphanizomenoides]MBK1988071.1 hypothetical protein [Sphaerospermopsis aphanizomenoides BCCUSP55]